MAAVGRHPMIQLGAVIGFGLSIAAIGHVATDFAQAFTLNSFKESLGFGSLGLSLLIATVFGANIVLAVAWCLLVSEPDSPRNPLLYIHVYALSHSARYIPGNVAHIGIRHVVARSHEIASAVLLRSTLWEIGAVSLATLPFVISAWLAAHEFPDTIFALFAMCGAILLGMRSKYFGRTRMRQVLALYFVFHAASSFVFLFVLIAASHQSLRELPLVLSMGAYIFAWLIGLLTPGSPAGLGVREIVLLTSLEGYVGAEPLLIALTATRLITFLGDLGFGALGLALGRMARGVP